MNRRSGFALLLELLLVVAVLAFLGVGSLYYKSSSSGSSSGKSSIENDLEALQKAKDIKILLESRNQALMDATTTVNQ